MLPRIPKTARTTVAIGATAAVVALTAWILIVHALSPAL